jgi:nucleoside-diphosphate-sugar epimerase
VNVLIIGGTRFVGYQLVWRLLARRDRITILNRGSLPDPFGDGVERLIADRTGPDFGKALAGRAFDAVVDFAAYTAPDVEGVRETLGERAGHYVFISSGQVYLVRANRPRPAREADYDGALLPEPSDPDDRRGWLYGMGKRAAEDTLVRHADSFPATRLRLPMVNGERDYYQRIQSYLWRLLDGGSILLPDGGAEPMRHVYSGAVVRAVADLLGDPAAFGAAYNLAQDETPTLVDLLGLLADLVGAELRLVPISRARLAAAGLDPLDVSPVSGRWMSFLDPGRAKAERGFRHEPLLGYLDKIVACFLNHPPPEPPGSYRQGRDAERGLAAENG